MGPVIGGYRLSALVTFSAQFATAPPAAYGSDTLGSIVKGGGQSRAIFWHTNLFKNIVHNYLSFTVYENLPSTLENNILLKSYILYCN